MTTLPPSPLHTSVHVPIMHEARKEIGAGNETRTRDPDLGKVVLYQLSYSRIIKNRADRLDGSSIPTLERAAIVGCRWPKSRNRPQIARPPRKTAAGLNGG